MEGQNPVALSPASITFIFMLVLDGVENHNIEPFLKKSGEQPGGGGVPDNQKFVETIK